MKKYMYLLSAGFFSLATLNHFRHDFASDDFRRTKISQFRMGNMLANMPQGGFTREQALESMREANEQYGAKIRGDKAVTIEDVQYADWIANQREKSYPLTMFLFGAGLLFLFGGMIKAPDKLTNSTDKVAQ